MNDGRRKKSGKWEESPIVHSNMADRLKNGELEMLNRLNKTPGKQLLLVTATNLSCLQGASF